ncbi:MAG: YraN family protein [Minisyncoccia bacterium]
MDYHIILGKTGEDIASKYLESKKYKIILRNFKKTFGEIDIVAKEKNNTLVFVEVKTIEKNSFDFLPEDEMSFSKIKKLKKICEYFALKNKNLIDDQAGWRIDLIAILKNKDQYEIKHYENIL